jgi:hypothetical protein
MAQSLFADFVECPAGCSKNARFAPYYLERHLREWHGLGHCEQCGKLAVLHKVKGADDMGLFSMEICDACNDT